MSDNLLIFKQKPKKINLCDIDKIGILLKNGNGVLIPKRFNKYILDLLKINNIDSYID